jgi:hypothetical protein
MLGIQRNAMFGAMAYQWNAVDVGGPAVGSRTAITLTAQQQVQVSTAQSKFGGASAYFDGGTDDYILVDHTQFSHAYSDNFTYECWFRLDSLPSVFTMLATGSTRGDYLSIYNKSGTWTITAPVSDGSTAYTQIRNIGFTPSTNTWYHVALVKDGASLKMFLDGTELTTNNGSAGTMTADKGWNGVSRIGDWASGTNYATLGYIDEVRWSSTARYTSSFTPDALPFTNDADTLLLVHMDGANGDTTFTDDITGGVGASGRTAKTVTASGDAQVSTAQSKFGGASLYSDGATDYLTVDAHSDFVMGSDDFTLECWVRPASSGVGSGDQIISKWSGGNGYSFGLTYGSSSPKNNIRALINDTGGIRGVNMGSNPLTVDAWNHVALVVESGTLALYANGNRLGTTSVTAFNDATNTDITISALGGGSYSPNHYQDEVRISDIARYTGSTYTVPTAAFTNDANTLLLLHMDGATGDTTFTDDNAVAAPVATPYTADGIVIPSSARLYGTIGTNNASSSQYQFTFSAWVKHDGTNFTYVWCGSNSNYAFAGGRVAIGATGFVQYYGYNGANNGWVTQISTADYAVPANTWTHIAVAFDNTSSFNNGVNAQIYVNGTSQSVTNTRFNTNANLGFDLATDMSLHGRRIPSSVYSSGAMSYAQVWIDDTFVDLSTNIGSFIDVGTTKPVDMGTDGTMSGLAAPMIYHYGDTSTFYNNNGRTTGNNITYTFTAQGGTITDTDTDS